MLISYYSALLTLHLAIWATQIISSIIYLMKLGVLAREVGNFFILKQ